MELNLNNIDRICYATDDRLWNAYSQSVEEQSDSLYDSNLIFPVYSGRQDDAIRISEQEARFAFAESISGTSYLYSVETPTREGYQLTGSKPMSAQTDITLYDRTRQPILNVEFKAKGASTSARSSFSIEKDIQKLLREPVPGMWFHILESIDNHTIRKLFDVIAQCLFDTTNKFQGNIRKTHLIFHCCVLRHRFSLHKCIEIVPERNILENLQGLFKFSYTVNRSGKTEIFGNNGWFVYGLDEPAV